ncbi:hypothetical protein ACH4E8_34300 [Streptomyces sp. NPDC017979]|uniref:hypothetical protein n=1 Tax=Streptomyces sp. NPDC017979 TaxID=3365024 RepID=UPI0037AFC7DF
MHRPLRLASAEHATLTLAAAYEGAVTKTSKQKCALTCPAAPAQLAAEGVAR